MSMEDIHAFLDEKVKQYNHPSFIETDPISIPHLFSDPQDIAISGFLVSIISWGQRPVILRNGKKLMELMEGAPREFLMEAQAKDFLKLKGFVHRTFNGSDCHFFISRLANLYRSGETLESLFRIRKNETDMGAAICRARSIFLAGFEESTHARHFSNPATGSAAKRLNMFLRWMIRRDKKDVDFGIWKDHNPALLVCPLDVHSGNTARKLGLLRRNANDWKAAMELTENLRKLSPRDPILYDFALFGLGVFEKF